jgi:hypothetical protein
MHPATAAFLGVVAAAALAAFAVYRWRQRKRIRRIKDWVDAYVVDRYHKLPGDLHVNCSDDTLWPVLVGFADPLTGARHRLRFDCPGANATFSLISEEQNAPAPAVSPGR